MFIRKALRRQNFLFAHIKSTNPFPVFTVNDLQSSLRSSSNRRFASVAAQAERSITSENGDSAGKSRKPYDVLFKEAVGLVERSGDFREGEGLGGRLMELELELREISVGTDPKLKGDSGVRKRRRRIAGKVVEDDDSKLKPNPASRLISLFGKKGLEKQKPLVEKESLAGRKISGETGEGKRSIALFEKKKDVERYCKELEEKEEDLIVKGLSPEMVVLARHLYEEGYFRDANFLPGNRFDVKGFESPYAQGFLKFAAEQFGRDKQEIAKWLSGSDLRALAVFGCPSLAKRNVFAAKSLRRFFQIPENTVCGKCILKQSCKFVNQSVWKSGSKNLNLSSLMSLLTAYALEAVPPPLVLPKDIKARVNRLLKDVINLSKIVPDAARR